jgi:hypothetical protein
VQILDFLQNNSPHFWLRKRSTIADVLYNKWVLDKNWNLKVGKKNKGFIKEVEYRRKNIKIEIYALLYTVDKSNITDTSHVKYCQFCVDPEEYIYSESGSDHFLPDQIGKTKPSKSDREIFQQIIWQIWHKLA